MTFTVGDLLRDSGLSVLEARALLAHRLRLPRERLVAHPELRVDRNDAAAFAALVRRRSAGEPLAYLLGEKEFYGRSFVVTPDVLVPRPETELLVDLALERMRPLRGSAGSPESAGSAGLTGLRVLDLGTGSGCIAVTLALECPGAAVTATDASSAALAIAYGNARQLGAHIEFRQGDWYDAVPNDAVFSLVVANPPYVAPADSHLDALRFEPRQALTDGRDGLSCLENIVAGATAHLAPGGWLLVEHGYDQATAVAALFARSGLTAETVADAAGLPRVTLGHAGQARV